MIRVRQLRASDVIPADVRPRRYRNAGGYIRLRWRVSDEELIECYEHRWVAGLGPDDTRQVHHKNGQRDDNRPENLEIVASLSEHIRKHHGVSWDVDEAMRLYRNGWATTRLAAHYGLNNATIFRTLRSRGFVFDRAEKKRVPVSVSDIVRLHNEGQSLSAIGRALGVSRDIVRFRLRHYSGPSGAHAPTKDRMKK